MEKKRFLVYISALVGWGFCFFCQRTLPSAVGYMTSVHRGSSDTSAAPSETENFEPVITMEDYGQLQNLFVIAYSTSILLGGFLSDHFNPRILFFMSMCMSGVLCAVFPLVTGNAFLRSLVWLLFGCFEGCCWPATAKMVKQMFTPAELGVWWSFLSMTSNLAATVSPLFVSYVIENSNWQTGFYVTGILPVLMLPPIALIMRSNGVHVVTPKMQQTLDDSKRATPGHKWYKVFYVSTLRNIILVYIILWVAKSSIQSWALLYLQDVCQQLPNKALAMSMIQFGGVIGKIVMGNLSTLVIKMKLMKRTGLLCVSMSTVTILLFIFGADSFKDYNEIVILLVNFFIGFAIDGSVVLTNLAAMETVPDSQSGSALGLATFSSQFLGRSFGAGYAFSWLQQSYGWTAIYQAVAMLCILAATLSGYIAINN